ncbi:MAG: hypothetical protein V4648_05010 [Bacteroidota bacterium]
MPAPTQLITKAFAITLNQNYINERSRLISGEIGYDDANAIWYSLEELENYIAYIKSEAAKIDYTADGIRFYLGVYPNEPEYGDKAGMTNIFLSPTGYQNGQQSSNADIADIDPMNGGGLGNPPIIDYPLL